LRVIVFREEDATDMKSRHKGKLHTEQLLRESRMNFTSVRPVYIYGPLNYNPVEEYFFHRHAQNRPICVPGSGMQLTQLGHVKDLANAFAKCLLNGKASRQVYNISGMFTVHIAADVGPYPGTELAVVCA
jgi:nucleoside-diphosphate-sugar epimerase